VPILARTGGLLAHLAEEQQQPLGFLMASHAEEAVTYERKTAAGADAVES
jgi:citrate synthase